MRVIVTGRLKQRSYETREGEKRTVYEVEVDDVGPSLKNASAKVTKAARSGGEQPGPQASPAGARNGGRQQEDPWAQPGDGDRVGARDEVDARPPF